MRKKFFLFTILILSICMAVLVGGALCVSKSSVIPKSDFKDVIFDEIMASIKKGGRGWVSWEEGIKEDYGGRLKSITFTMEVLQEESNATHTMITARLVFVGSFINKAGNKERLILERIIAFLCDNETRKPIQLLVIEENRKTIPGWNGKDV